MSRIFWLVITIALMLCSPPPSESESRSGSEVTPEDQMESFNPETSADSTQLSGGL